MAITIVQLNFTKPNKVTPQLYSTDKTKAIVKRKSRKGDVKITNGNI